MLWDSEEGATGGWWDFGPLWKVPTHPVCGEWWRSVSFRPGGVWVQIPLLPHNKLCASKRGTYYSEPQFPLSSTQGGGAVGKVRMPWKGQGCSTEPRTLEILGNAALLLSWFC